MTSIKSITSADWAPHIKRAVYAIGAAIAFTYTAGLLTGEFVHRLNDRLAAWASGRPAPVATPAAVEPTRVQRQALAPLPVIAAPDLSTLKVTELRKMARAAGFTALARSGRKADLLEVLG